MLNVRGKNSRVLTFKREQLDALRALSRRDVVADGVASLRRINGGSLFVSFSVVGERIPCIFKHRYLIAPNGTINQLPVKIIDDWRYVSCKEGRSQGGSDTRRQTCAVLTRVTIRPKTGTCRRKA